MDITAQTLEGKQTTIDQNLLNDLRSKVGGQVITPVDSEYDNARVIWNVMIDRRPAFIVQCTGTADVIQAVRFAKRNRLLISIRGAGHNIAGRALQDNVMLIDLSKMRTVQVDPDAKTVVVSPGATLGDLDHETQIYGLALPVGINSTTGVAGLTLGGGFGWLSRKFGMTVDHLISFELVTVEGERIHCDKNNHPDLFWAITGGGGNFGIVTSFKFNLLPVGPEVMSGPAIFKVEDAKEVLTNYREFCKNSSENLCVWAVIRNAPPFPFLDESYHGKPVLILASLYNGPMEEGKEALEKVKELGNPIGDGIAPHLFTDFQQAFDPLLTPGFRNYWKSHNFKEISDDLIDILVEYSTKLPSLPSEIIFAQMGGATNRIARDATAYPHRDIEFIMNVHTRWEEAEDDEACVAWARKLFEAAKPFSSGGIYVNFVSEGDDSIDGAFAENAQRLALVKSKYDPENILRANLNIAPSR